MSDLITLSKSDPRFHSYIEGTFSKELRALPLKSLNVNTDSEQVTFRLLPKAQIAPPFLGLHWLQILKVRNFLMVAFPLLLIFVKNWRQGTIVNPVVGGLAAFGAFCLMTAGNLRNDYLDHLSGLDRLHPQSESHAIQKGWVTASQVQKWSWFYLGLGMLFGIPALIRYPEILMLVGAFAVMGIFGLTSFKMGLKYRRWSELTTFLLLGPLLTVGIQLALGGQFDFEAVMLGGLTGWLSVFYLHLKHFEHVMVNDKAQFQNTMTWLGFEKAKRWLAGWWFLFSLGLMAYHFYYSNSFWTLILLMGSLFVSLPLFRSLRRLQSPLGSQMKNFIRLGNQSILFLMGLWTLEMLWFFWIQG